MILEADLDDLVAEAEHYGVLSPHPLLDVDHRLACSVLLLHLNIASIDHVGRSSACRAGSPTSAAAGRAVGLKVGAEVLQKSDLLLQLFGEIDEGVSRHHILLLGRGDGFALVVVEALAQRVLQDDLS